VEQLWGLQPLTRRDAEAACFDHLFALARPRDDTPVVLPDPAASGIRDCEDSLSHRLAGKLESLPGELSGPLEATLVGFVQVAVARELHLAAAAERDVSRAVDREKDRLLTTYHGIRTKFDAVKYIHGVASRYRETKEQGRRSPPPRPSPARGEGVEGGGST
jgi:hypothetical protein